MSLDAKIFERLRNGPVPRWREVQQELAKEVADGEYVYTRDEDGNPIDRVTSDGKGGYILTPTSSTERLAAEKAFRFHLEIADAFSPEMDSALERIRAIHMA